MGLIVSVLMLVILPGSFLFTMVGVGYPAYASILCADSGEDAKQWLSYWVIYSLLQFLMGPIDFILSFIPFFFIAKYGLLFYLFLPSTKGATVLFDLASPQIEALLKKN